MCFPPPGPAHRHHHLQQRLYPSGMICPTFVWCCFHNVHTISQIKFWQAGRPHETTAQGKYSFMEQHSISIPSNNGDILYVCSFPSSITDWEHASSQQLWWMHWGGRTSLNFVRANVLHLHLLQ